MILWKFKYSKLRCSWTNCREDSSYKRPYRTLQIFHFLHNFAFGQMLVHNMDPSTKNCLNTPSFFLRVSRASCEPLFRNPANSISPVSVVFHSTDPWHGSHAHLQLAHQLFFNIKVVLPLPFQGAILWVSQISKWPKDTKLFKTTHLAVTWIIRVIDWRDPHSLQRFPLPSYRAKSCYLLYFAHVD